MQNTGGENVLQMPFQESVECCGARKGERGKIRCKGYHPGQIHTKLLPTG